MSEEGEEDKCLETQVEEKVDNNAKEKTGIRSSLDVLANSVNKCFRWIWSDLRQSHLIWLKLIFFFQSASMIVLYPYLVLHMKSLGLSLEEVALVNTIVPVADIVGPTLAGIIADKIGNFRLFMSGLTALGGIASVLIYILPPKMVGDSGGLCCSTSGMLESNLTVLLESNLTVLLESNLTVLLESNLTVCSYNTSSLFEEGTARCVLDNQTILLNASSLVYTEEPGDCQLICYKQSRLDDWDRVLWLYIALRAILDILRASSLMMFEGAVVVTIKQLGGDYGLQKLFGTFGAIIFGPISGKLIDYTSTLSGRDDYSSVFYLYCGMRIACALFILKLDLQFKQPARKVFKDVGKLILRPHMTVFLFMFFICGSLWGLLETYFFLFLQVLGSTKFTMGISLAIGTIAGIPLTIASGSIIKCLGQVNVVVLALAIYAIRLLGYSLIHTPGDSLYFEVLKPFGNSLLMIAAMTYAKDNATISTMASLEGIMGALYFGVGKALGGLLGGLAIDWVGERSTFRMFAGLSLACAVFYSIFNLLYTKYSRKDVKMNEDAAENEADTKTTYSNVNDNDECEDKADRRLSVIVIEERDKKREMDKVCKST